VQQNDEIIQNRITTIKKKRLHLVT